MRLTSLLLLSAFGAGLYSANAYASPLPEAPAAVADPMRPAHTQPADPQVQNAPEALTDPLDARELEKSAETLEKDRSFSVTFENDVFSGRDDGYTNGVRASYTARAERTPMLMVPLEVLPIFPEEGTKRVSYAIGQSMFTPNDITTTTLQPNDRPYAGWLYGSVGLISDTGKQYDTLELTLGVVGPAALGKQTQRFVHNHITGSPDPRGWEHQLDNEPGVILSYERKWRSYYQFSVFGHGVDFTPHLGTSLGNVMTDLRTGAMFRIGRNLPSDYGPPRIRPSISGSDFFIPTNNFGWYLFSGVEGRFVARNIFLDGNTFSDSHSVDKENWVGDVQAGLALTYDNWRLAYTHVFRTREYKTQEHAESFGAFTISHQF